MAAKRDAGGAAEQDLWLKVYRCLSESQRRWYAAQRALELGRGGIEQVHALTGLSCTTIRRGIHELQESRELQGETSGSGRVRRPGGGRKKLTDIDPETLGRLSELVEESTADDPASLLSWTVRSTRDLAAAMGRAGFPMSAMTVSRRLRELGYTLRAGRRLHARAGTAECARHFRRIDETARRFIARGDPVISVAAQRRAPPPAVVAGGPWEVLAAPAAVSGGEHAAPPHSPFDVATEDLVEIAVESIRQWWRRSGAPRYRRSSQLLVVTEVGRGDEDSTEGWKRGLRKLCSETGLRIKICYYPPGTSRWRQIAHRTVSLLLLDRPGRPPIGFETVIELIGGS